MEKQFVYKAKGVYSMRAGQNKVQRERRGSKRLHLASGGEEVLTFVDDYYSDDTSVSCPELDDATGAHEPGYETYCE